MDKILIPFSVNRTKSNIIHSKMFINSSLKQKNFTRINDIIIKLMSQIEENAISQEIVTTLKTEAFDLKGGLIELTQVMNSKDSNEFSTEIRIKSDDLIHTIYFNQIPKVVAEEFNRLSKHASMYFIHFKAHLVPNKEKDSGQYTLKFYCTKSSRVFYSQLSIIDNDCRLNFSREITQHYEFIQNQKEERMRNELMRISNGKINSDNIHHIVHKTAIDTLIDSNDNVNMHSDNDAYSTSKSIITNKELMKVIDDIDIKEKDFEYLLTRKVSASIYWLKTILETIKAINKPARVTVCGIVICVKIDIKVTCIDILSLIDSNVIKVIHYPNNWRFEPLVKQIISFDQIPIKINKNFEFILENPLKANVKLIGTVTDEEFNAYRKFRVRIKNMPFGSIISLLSPTIIRSVQKYLIVIKDISKITARIETDYPSGFFQECPSLKLFAKCVVDDGSFEAQLNLYDEDVARLLKLSNVELKHINAIAQECKNCVLYQKTSDSLGYISKEAVGVNIKKQFITYCIPYSKIASKHFNDNKYDKYFINLGQKNHRYKNQAMNTAYINGDIFYEKGTKGSFELLAKPILKSLYIEERQYNELY